MGKTQILIAYHAHCIDGFTAAWACHKGLVEVQGRDPDDISLMPVSYNDIDAITNAAPEYLKIYIVDFSIPTDAIHDITRITDLVIIDHHKTAVETYAAFAALSVENFCDSPKTIFGAVIYMDMNECGASLVWKIFFPTQHEYIPKLIEYVKDYDLWQFKLESTRGVNKYLRLRKKTIAGWDALNTHFAAGFSLTNIIEAGNAMQEYHDSVVSELVDQAEPCMLDGKKGLVVNCSPQFTSDVGHRLAKISGTYGATWQQEPGGSVKWGLRSAGTYDVSAIAKVFGGGGHRNAAGFYLSAPTDDMSHPGITLWAK